MKHSWNAYICLGFFLLGPRTTISSNSRSQSYKPSYITDDIQSELNIMMDDDNTQYQDDDSKRIQPSKMPFSVSGQYSKSIHVNTQSKAQTHIYDPDMPIFDLDHSANVTALLGKTAVLNCRVKNIGNKTVSWVRHRDIHLLTVGRFSYTSDQRFSALHTDESEDWLLKIHYLQKRDAGWYGCQISTTPPVSHMVYLSVVESETSILGGPDVYINSGSRLALTCSVKYSPDPPAFIFWYHNEKLVSYGRSHGGIQVQIEKGVVSTSRLLVQLANMKHTGKYTCYPSNSSPKSVTVHVLQGEKPAAIQHENNSAIAHGPSHSTSCHFYFTVTTVSLLTLTHVIYR